MRGLSLSTRLILLLTLMVGAVMALGGWYLLRQRVAILEQAMRNELQAHALTLQLALEEAYRAGRTNDAQRLIDRLSENPKIYSVILFDQQGQIAILSNPKAPPALRQPPAVHRVLSGAQQMELWQDSEVFSILLPLNLGRGRRAAFELSQPAAFIAADKARAARDIALITLTLFGAVILTVLVVARYNLLRPINELLQGATQIGRGQLGYRVIAAQGGHELTRLARAFNEMAARLAEQRQAAEREAQERLELERQLRQSERLAVVGRLAAGVAHELGAPLNVIKGRVELVQAHATNLTEKQQRNLSIINSQADAITHIVRQLLNLARPLPLQREPIKLSLLLDGVIELLEAEAAQAGVSLQVPALAGLWITGDRKLLHQVLLNVCLNAVQAMSQGGTLRFSVEPAPAEPETETAAPPLAQPCLALRISDTGPGIAPEVLEHIFDPFFTTKDVGQGTGLGLSVSRRIVEEHGGRIEAANQTAGGAVFTLWLPQIPAPAEVLAVHATSSTASLPAPAA
jgi:two-component system NtrC family sensor kinase